MVSGGIKRGEQHDKHPLLVLNNSTGLILASTLDTDVTAYV